MNEYEKSIIINENHILRYFITNNHTHVIREDYLKRNNIIKSYNLYRWDDYSFNGWSKNNHDDILTFEFDINHPLYIPLLHLLNGKEHLIIDDDDTYEDNKKFLELYKDDDKIFMMFVNTLNKKNTIEKYHVFTKNIGFDNRCKLDAIDKDAKLRLYFFYQEVYQIINEMYHQMNMEEYLIKNKLMSTEEEKKYVRKINNIYGIVNRNS